MIEYDIHKILVPVDFSATSLNALDSAIAMAKQHDAHLILMNVVEPAGLAGAQTEGLQSDEALVNQVHHSQQELQALQHSIIEKWQLDCEIVGAKGNVSAAIINISTIRQVDIIVMGTHGVSGFKPSFIGLNAFNVVKRATCPVLTIPLKKRWDSFKKILFPVRPILSALEKYDFIRKIIRKNNASLKVLGLATNNENDVEMIKGLALQLNEKLKIDEVESATYFKVGQNMAEEVLKIAALMETDLIVITASVDHAGKQLLVGPYTRDIINHALFPVLSIKPREEGEHNIFSKQEVRGELSQQISFYN